MKKIAMQFSRAPVPASKPGTVLASTKLSAVHSRQVLLAEEVATAHSRASGQDLDA
jgi:hypothetical protein